MLVELGGKAGKLCQQAQEGKLRCPLIVRQNGEDAITGNVMGVLRVLQPRWWVAPLLNHALGADRFLRQFHRHFRIDLWQNRSPFPVELLGWREGSSQIEVTLRWENPPTTVFMEWKYEADLSPDTANGDPHGRYPSDQLVRNVRVGLLECGWYRTEQLFHSVPRDFVQVLVAPKKGNLLVAGYRDRARLLASIPHNDKLLELPQAPFVGELSFRDMIDVLMRQRRFFTAPERRLIDLLAAYLEHKLAELSRTGRGSRPTANGVSA